MPPSALPTAIHNIASPLSIIGNGSRRVSSIRDSDAGSNHGLSRPLTSRKVASRKASSFDTFNISGVVDSIKRRSGDELGTTASFRLLDASYETLLEWIRTQRMSNLPAEGSSYDKVLAWAQLFVERLHSFDLAIEEFAGDSYIAAQLAYGYCSVLLELGQENALALMSTFGFFHSISLGLANLLERTELFGVSQDIREQLVLALTDLVTLVASVATHFHKAISGMTTASASIDIYEVFGHQIHTFTDRCEKIAESMWRHQLWKENFEGEKVSEVKSIQSWLTPEDRALANVTEAISQFAQDREEMTCLWLPPYLARFLKSEQIKTLTITGKPGSGKTVLASVIVDHLQHPIGGITYQTLFVPINGRIPAVCSSHAIAKAILLQLFQKRIGNVQLFQVLSDAFDRCTKAVKDSEYDDILWTAVERAFATTLRGAKDLVVVVDGLDESSSDEAVLLQRLITATSKADNTKLVALGAKRPSPAQGLGSVSITEDLIFDDISAVARTSLGVGKIFNSLPEMDQETVVGRIAQASHGSFLWAKLATKWIRSEKNVDSFYKSLDTVTKASLADFVSGTSQSSNVSDEARLMMLWLATADRPLSVKELAALASVEVDKQTVVDRPVDPLQTLKPLASLVFLRGSQVLLRHGLIRTALLDLFSKGKLVPGTKDQNADLVTRLLVYIKATVTLQKEPSLSPLEPHESNSLVNKHPLLEFAIRYWPTHLRRTVVFTKDGDAPTAKEYGKVFPTAPAVVLLGETLWENQPTPERVTHHLTMMNMYRQILSVKNITTLQSIIFLAFLYRQANRVPDAISLTHEAATLSRTLLSPQHIVTLRMATAFLELTADKVTDTMTDIMVKREEILILVVECSKSLYGQTSENVVVSLRQLLEHYQFTKQEQKVQEIMVSIKSITSSDHTVSSQDTLSSRQVQLRSRDHKDTTESGVGFLSVHEEDELIVTADLATLEKQAEKYRAEGQAERAELTYVDYWRRASKESIEEKMKAALAYTRFLKSQKREHEASSILSSVWQEHEQSSRSMTQTSSSYLQEIAKTMKTVGLTASALAIFKKCSQYYQSNSSTHTSAFREVQENIESTSMAIMESASSGSTTTTTESTLEQVVLELSASGAAIDQSLFTATHKLIGLYISQRRWRDATHVLKRVLRGVWPSFLSSSIQDVVLPSKFVENCVELAELLAQCYNSRRRVTKEEDVRVRIYRAVRTDRKVDDKLREQTVTELLRFFERTSQTDRIINIRQDLLNDYIKHYGPEHPTVIKSLWTLAELTRPRPIFVDYYLQIIRILNKDSPVCHPEAFEPLIVVATELWKQGRYSDAVQHYSVLFTTFLNQPKQSPKFQDQTFVRELFSRYTQCMRSVRTEFTMIHKVTVDYQSKCKTLFGATASISIQATLSLAKLCQESKRYEHEAISLYEELLSIKSEEIDHQEISATLNAIYEEQASGVSTNSTKSVSSEQRQRVVKILKQRISSARETYGYAHEESLSKMQELVSFHSKRNETQSVLEELNQATVQVLSSEKSSTRLAAAAAAIASSYIASGQVQKVQELSEDVYRQIIMKDTSNVKSVNLASKERQSLAFLAQLEYSIRRDTSVTITDIMATLLTESIYFEDFRSQMKSKTATLHTVSVSASRLYQFLLGYERQTAAARVFDEFTNYFIAAEGKRIKLTETAQIKIFILTILDHFSTHQSQDFVRSIGITSNDHVVQLLQNQRFETACDLALAAFQFLSSQESYRTPGIAKFVFTLGMTIGGRDLTNRPDEATRKRMLSVSSKIIQDVLGVIRDLKINIAQIGLEHLNKLIGLLGEQQDYKTLAWLLTLVWNNRKAQRWQPEVTLALGHRFILARYLVGDAMAALRLAEDIQYNCRRVHGGRHPSTLEMTVLLSQVYTGVAQRYQSHKGGQDIANRYYQKSAALHENVLRIFSDPMFAELEGGLEGTMSMDGSAYDLDLGDSSQAVNISEGEHVRQHLRLLKLAVERLGSWPKDYSEYEQLNADVFREFASDLNGVEGVEKWDLKKFGSGKAESNEDMLNADLKNWELVDSHVVSEPIENGEEEVEL